MSLFLLLIEHRTQVDYDGDADTLCKSVGLPPWDAGIIASFAAVLVALYWLVDGWLSAPAPVPVPLLSSIGARLPASDQRVALSP